MTKKGEILFLSSISVLFIVAFVVLSRLADRQLYAATPAALISKGFEPKGFLIQNKSEVMSLAKSRIGWESLRSSMAKAGATATEMDKVISVAQSKMSAPFLYDRAGAPLWPVEARVGWIPQQKVWIIEAAAPKSYSEDTFCATGLTMEQIHEIEQRSLEACAHRVLVIQSKSPYAILDQQDIVQ